MLFFSIPILFIVKLCMYLLFESSVFFSKIMLVLDMDWMKINKRRESMG